MIGGRNTSCAACSAAFRVPRGSSLARGICANSSEVRRNTRAMSPSSRLVSPRTWSQLAPDAHDSDRERIQSLLDAEQFERFLHTSYVGQKRFSLEGGETLIPVLDAIIQSAPSRGVFKIAMGRADPQNSVNKRTVFNRLRHTELQLKNIRSFLKKHLNPLKTTKELSIK